MERAKGFEPFAQKSELIDFQAFSQSDKSDYTQIRAQGTGATCPNLAKVVTAWSKLPPPLKAAILAIVGTVDSSPEVAP
jgi:hypothetical protein